MKFKSKLSDINIELTTLNNSQVLLTPVNKMDAKSCIEVLKKLRLIENNQADLAPSEVYAKELSLIYGKPSEFFIENVDPKTIKDMAQYAIQGLNGTAKN